MRKTTVSCDPHFTKSTDNQQTIRQPDLSDTDLRQT